MNTNGEGTGVIRRPAVRWRLGAQVVSVPDWVVDLESFRRWAEADDFPEEGRICWLCGEVDVDMSTEQLFTHGQVKTRFTVVLGGETETRKLGYYWSDGPRLSNEVADISVKPDAVFVAYESVLARRVQFRASLKEEGHVEMEGSPDMVLEVVSLSSVQKDPRILRKAYRKAGVKEYWLVDARQDPLTFEILRRAERGFIPTRKQKGWLRSQVFGKSFRLTQSVDTLGKPAYTLEARE